MADAPAPARVRAALTAALAAAQARQRRGPDQGLRRELLSRLRLLLGDAAGGWRELERAFELDAHLHACYGEADESRSDGARPLERLFACSGEPVPQLQLPALDAVVRASPASPWAWAWRGALRRRRLDYEGAASDLERAWTLGERSADVLTWLGEAKVQLGRTAEGLQDMRRALSLPGARAWHRAWLGRARLNAARDPAGLSDLDAAVAQQPDACLPWAWRGLARLRLGLPGAAKDFKRAQTLDRGEARRWLAAWHAMALSESGSAERALEAVARARRAMPSYPPLLRARATALRRLGRVRRWARALDEAARADLKQAHSLGRLARPRLLEMDRLLSRAASARRPSPAALRWRGLTRGALGRSEASRADLERAARLEPEEPLGRLWLGEALAREGRPKQALRELARALRLGAPASAAQAARARALLALGDLKRALRVFDAAAREDAHNVRLLTDLGAARLLAGDADGAKSALEKAAACDPGCLPALVDLAEACRRLRLRKQSRACLSRAFAVDEPAARERLARWAGLRRGRA